MFCQRDFPFPTWLKVSQGAHPAAKPSAGLQYCCMPLIFRTAHQMLQQGAGRAPTCREDGARLQQPDAEGNGPQRDSDKMQGQGTCSVLKLAGKTGEDQRGPQRKACQEPPVIYHMLCLGAGVEVLLAFINPAHDRVPKFFKASGMLTCNGHTEQTAL